jgi:5'-nucleotidase / UDP-sugar diphosphatase
MKLHPETLVRLGSLAAVALAALLTFACGSDGSAGGGAGGAPHQGGAGGHGAGGGALTLTIFHTTDEHGWLERHTDSGWVYGGAADVAAWMAADGLDPASALLVSSGDNWVGPAISGYFQGESAVEVFNAMGYRASALGNHEFDYGEQELAARVAQAAYPYLGANVKIAASGELPSYDVATTVVQVQGVQIGLVGVTTPQTTTATNPHNVADLRFDSIHDTLEVLVPELRAAGADVVIVLAHEGSVAMSQVAEQLDVPVDAIFCGHDHALAHAVVHGIPVLDSAADFLGYTEAWLQFDPQTRQTSFVDRRFVTVRWQDGDPPPHEPDPTVQSIVDDWAAQLDGALAQTIGYSATGIELMSWAQANWVCDAWLTAFPEAQIVIQNFGGLRQAIASGDLRLLDLYGMLPFENRIYELELTGAQIRDDIVQATASCGTQGACSPAVGGLRYQGTGDDVVLLQPDGQPLALDASYVVLVSDYVYAGGDGYLFATQDATPIDLGVSYRDPVVAWTSALGTSAADPLELHLDATPRSE